VLIIEVYSQMTQNKSQNTEKITTGTNGDLSPIWTGTNTRGVKQVNV
jgi:hypothetical protein